MVCCVQHKAQSGLVSAIEQQISGLLCTLWTNILCKPSSNMVTHLYCAVPEINMKPHNKYMVANITTQLYTNRLLSVINKRILLQGHGKLTT